MIDFKPLIAERIEQIKQASLGYTGSFAGQISILQKQATEEAEKRKKRRIYAATKKRRVPKEQKELRTKKDIASRYRSLYYKKGDKQLFLKWDKIYQERRKVYEDFKAKQKTA